jgi:hypothetical protein
MVDAASYCAVASQLAAAGMSPGRERDFMRQVAQVAALSADGELAGLPPASGAPSDHGERERNDG